MSALQYIFKDTHVYKHTCAIQNRAVLCTTVLQGQRIVPERNIGTVSMGEIPEVEVEAEVVLGLQSTSLLKSSAPSSNLPL
jgi:hypothetical protein